jgi:hypothetical protein
LISWRRCHPGWMRLSVMNEIVNDVKNVKEVFWINVFYSFYFFYGHWFHVCSECGQEINPDLIRGEFYISVYFESYKSLILWIGEFCWSRVCFHYSNELYIYYSLIHSLTERANYLLL